MSEWQAIETAPKDGTAISIRGHRFMRRSRYYATAVWAERKCPALTQGWFPANDKHDGRGPFIEPDGWRPLPATNRG